MKSFKRWTSGIVSSFDWVVSQVENHDALVSAAIRDVRDAGGRANMQLARVQKDGLKMKQRLVELQEQEERWKLRAIRIAEIDKKKAIECVRRKNDSTVKIKSLQIQIDEHQAIEQNLSEDLAKIDERIIQLHQQQNLLRTRQSRAEALSIGRQDDSFILSEIDEIFERWEGKVGEYELHSTARRDNGDVLEQEFQSEEEEEHLKAELEILLASQGE